MCKAVISDLYKEDIYLSCYPDLYDSLRLKRDI
jgi:hypothetical protein